MLSERKVIYDALGLANGNTRINVKVLGQKETELNADGPVISEEERTLLFEKIEKLTDGDYLVLSGSVQRNLGVHFYEDIMQCIKDKNVKKI